jgi:dTMP kinase
MTGSSFARGKTRGRFITVEGIEGSGKSTQLRYIQAFLESAGKSVVITREPGGTSVGEALRGLLLDPCYEAMASDTELLMVFAARAEHIAKLIRPAVAQGRWVVCDRFTDATYAYQGGGRGIARPRIAQLERWVQDGLRPDLTLLLDVSPEVGLARATARGAKDRFERESDKFFARTRATYLSQARRDPQRYRVIDAGPAVAAVQAEIAAVLEQFL